MDECRAGLEGMRRNPGTAPFIPPYPHTHKPEAGGGICVICGRLCASVPLWFGPGHWGSVVSRERTVAETLGELRQQPDCRLGNHRPGPEDRARTGVE